MTAEQLTLDNAELSIRTISALKHDDITLEKLTSGTMHEQQLLRVPRLGRKRVNEIKELLESLGTPLPLTEKEVKENGKYIDSDEEVLSDFHKVKINVIQDWKKLAQKTFNELTEMTSGNYTTCEKKITAFEKAFEQYKKNILDMWV